MTTKRLLLLRAGVPHFRVVLLHWHPAYLCLQKALSQINPPKREFVGNSTSCQFISTDCPHCARHEDPDTSLQSVGEIMGVSDHCKAQCAMCFNRDNTCSRNRDRTVINSDLEPNQRAFSRVLSSGLKLPFIFNFRVGADITELMKSGQL